MWECKVGSSQRVRNHTLHQQHLPSNLVLRHLLSDQGTTSPIQQKKKVINPRGPDVFRRIVAKLVAHIGVLRVVQPPAHQEVVESLLSEVTSCTSATKNVWSEGLASCLITSNTHRRVPQETSLADSPLKFVDDCVLPPWSHADWKNWVVGVFATTSARPFS